MECSNCKKELKHISAYNPTENGYKGFNGDIYECPHCGTKERRVWKILKGSVLGNH